MKHIYKIFIVSCLVASSFVDAGLIRGSGRGGSSGSTADTYYLIDDIHTNSMGIDTDYFEGGGFPSAYVSGGIDHAYAAPTFCVDYSIIEQNEQRKAAGVELLEEEPCIWEFQQHENLNVFGAYLIFLADPSLIDVSWTISNGVKDWTVAGFMDATGTPWLDAPIPSDMVVGEYWATVTITQNSGPNATFYRQNVHDSNLVNCDDSVTPIVCGYNLSSSDAYSSVSYGEILRIVPTLNAVTAPATLFIWFGGFIAIMFMRRRW
jgi:hypothetical protein